MTIAEIKTTISEQHLKHKVKKLTNILNLYFVKLNCLQSAKVTLEEETFKIHLKSKKKGYSDLITEIPISDIDLVIERYKRKIKYKTK
jgi:hypothetical protein